LHKPFQVTQATVHGDLSHFDNKSIGPDEMVIDHQRQHHTNGRKAKTESGTCLTINQKEYIDE
jgi:hypothetical protein